MSAFLIGTIVGTGVLVLVLMLFCFAAFKLGGDADDEAAAIYEALREQEESKAP